MALRAAHSLGIIGGSGLYSLDGLSSLREIVVDTPFGSPSSPIFSGALGGTTLYFIARHGLNHTIPPHQINYRANIYALKSLGVSFVLSVSAVGSLREDIHPGDAVIPDQFIDRTKSRADTFFGDGVVAHVAFGSPICPVLAAALLASSSPFPKVHPVGTYLCIEGPAFSTRAESQSYRQIGADIIGMTNLPESKLAREAELSYATLALVTDYDSWRSGEEVEASAIISLLKRNVALAKESIALLAPRLNSLTQPDTIRYALDAALMTAPQSIPDDALKRLSAILNRRVSAK